jgi:ABC-type multidrug transport system ATPase subunit
MASMTQDQPPIGLSVEGLGKRYGRVWILRDVSFKLKAGGRLVVRGGNGSGKSSILRLICGLDRASEGAVYGTVHTTASTAAAASDGESGSISPEQLLGLIAYSAPDLRLIEDLSALEQLEFHERFRGFKAGLDAASVLEAALLSGHGHKLVGELSSGMRQRLELSIALGTRAGLLVLDEPVSHLDRAGVDWYKRLLNAWCADQTIVTGSNYHDDEYPEGAQFLDLKA